MAWPIPDSWGEIPSTRLLADVPVSVSGLERAPLTIIAKAPVVEARAGEKVTIPLVHRRTSDFSGDKIHMTLIGAGFERAPGFDLPTKADRSEVTVDLKALNVAPGEYRVAVLGGGVVKYCHQPDQVAAEEAAAQRRLAEVKAAEAEVKRAATDAQKAPPAKKEQMTRTLAAVNARMKAATDALAATRQRLKQAQDAAQPRDIADILVSEPFTIRIKPGEKK